METGEVLNTRGSDTDFYGEQFRDKRRRTPGAPSKTFQVKNMWDVHHEIARRIVLGQKNVEIANALNVSPQMVSNTRNSPIVQEKVRSLQEKRDEDAVDVATRIKDLAPDALNVLEKMIEGEVDGEKIPAKLRAHHAEKLLDRAGHGAPKIIHGKMMHGHFTPQDLDEIKKRARLIGEANGTIVDVEEVIYSDE